MCSEIAPQLSFSRDLADENESQTAEDQQQWRRDANLLGHYSNTTTTITPTPPTADQPFEFSVSSNSGDQYSTSSADGIILPFHHRNTRSAADFNCSAAHHRVQSLDHIKLPPLPSLPTLPPLPTKSSTESDYQSRASSDHQNQLQSSPSTKSFWGFKGSSSLNCDLKKTLICSLPPPLSRSNSTGSVPPVPKKSPHQKPNFTQATVFIPAEQATVRIFIIYFLSPLSQRHSQNQPCSQRPNLKRNR
ncbi:unnamed protein product [Linum tenue]|uniref:Uncharacterized protein n=1 Tax=Linum tenue TaxID=586396 RepID=A0AAV0H8H5_9ROSI|nr:unnamed protein product [Linum tenue]